MKIKVNINLGDIKKGQVIDTPDKNGIPLDIYWRRRLKDAEYDNCCEVVKKTKPSKRVVKPQVVEPTEPTHEGENK